MINFEQIKDYKENSVIILLFGNVSTPIAVNREYAHNLGLVPWCL